jgi:DMSO/TMAO reductase YedYZ molybdopterin-dependent catalytic subunit
MKCLEQKHPLAVCRLHWISFPLPAERPEDIVDYVGPSTPDGGYYVGLDTASALYPQALLVYEMGGQPLTPEHGAPLRLFTPVKYGVKNLKRVGSLNFIGRRMLNPSRVRHAYFPCVAVSIQGAGLEHHGD